MELTVLGPENPVVVAIFGPHTVGASYAHGRADVASVYESMLLIVAGGSDCS